MACRVNLEPGMVVIWWFHGALDMHGTGYCEDSFMLVFCKQTRLRGRTGTAFTPFFRVLTIRQTRLQR